MNKSSLEMENEYLTGEVRIPTAHSRRTCFAFPLSYIKQWEWMKDGIYYLVTPVYHGVSKGKSREQSSIAHSKSPTVDTSYSFAKASPSFPPRKRIWRVMRSRQSIHSKARKHTF